MSSFFENGVTSSSSGSDSFLQKPVIVTGSTWWVNSATGSDSNSGTEALPFATLAHALSSATADNGDLIIVASGHSETLTSAITITKSVRIYGLGSGASAPNFTVNAAVNGFTIGTTPNGVELNNLYFPAGTTTPNTGRINIATNAGLVRITNCTFLCGANDTDTLVIGAQCYPIIESCSFSVTASGPASGIKITTASLLASEIRSCSFDGGSYPWTNGAIYSTVAHTNFVYDSLTLTNKAKIIHTAAAKGYVSNLSVANDCRVSV